MNLPATTKRLVLHQRAMDSTHWSEVEFAVPGVETLEAVRQILSACPDTSVVVMPRSAVAKSKVTRLQRNLAEFTALVRDSAASVGYIAVES